MIQKVLVFQAACFLEAAVGHLLDFYQRGWLPYRHAPLPLAIFWSTLAPLDLLAVWWLLRRPRAGLVLGTLIMVSDVAVNSYAKYALGYQGGYWDVSAQLQSAFLGFVLGCLPFLWPQLAAASQSLEGVQRTVRAKSLFRSPAVPRDHS